MSNSNIIPIRNSNIVTKQIDDEFLVIPVVDDIAQMDSIFGMNSVASFIWGNINGENTIKDIVGLLMKEYDIEADIAVADVNEFLLTCEKKSLIFYDDN